MGTGDGSHESIYIKKNTLVSKGCKHGIHRKHGHEWKLVPCRLIRSFVMRVMLNDAEGWPAVAELAFADLYLPKTMP